MVAIEHNRNHGMAVARVATYKAGLDMYIVKQQTTAVVFA